MSATRVLPRMISMFSSLSTVDALLEVRRPADHDRVVAQRVDQHVLRVQVVDVVVEPGQRLDQVVVAVVAVAPPSSHRLAPRDPVLPVLRHHWVLVLQQPADPLQQQVTQVGSPPRDFVVVVTCFMIWSATENAAVKNTELPRRAETLGVPVEHPPRAARAEHDRH